MPIAEIIFPSIDSLVTYDVEDIVLRGTVFDDSGVQSITVNDSSVTVTEVYSDSEGETVSWEIQLPIVTGQNTFIVGATDIKGNSNPAATQVIVNTEAVIPSNFTLDSSNNKLFGMNPWGSMVEINWETGASTNYFSVFNNYSSEASCFKTDLNEYFYTEGEGDDEVFIRSYNLSSGLTTHWATVSIDPASEGIVAPGSSGELLDLECNSTADNIYILLTFFDGSATVLSKILELEPLATPVISVYKQTNVGDETDWLATALDISEQKLISTYNNANIRSFDLVNDESEQLANSIADDFVNFSLDSTNNLFYYLSDSGVNPFDVKAYNFDTDLISPVSVYEKDEDFAFGQPKGIEVWPEEDRAIVFDWDLNMLVNIDLTSGIRSELFANHVGTGPRLINATDIVMTSDESSVYIVDNGWNVDEKVLKINLATGNREQVGNITQTNNTGVDGITLDETSGILYVGVENKIYSIDVDDGTTEIIASNSIGTGAVVGIVSDVLFDDSNDRLLYSDELNEAIYAIDLETLNRTVVSLSGSQGEGPVFSDINSMIFNEDKSGLYITNHASVDIMSVDLATGDRALFLDDCQDGASSPLFYLVGNLEGTYLNPVTGELLILGWNTLAYDFETESCRVYSSNSSGFISTSDNKTYSLQRSFLGQFDPDSRNLVIMSR